VESRLDLALGIAEGFAVVNNVRFLIQVCRGIIQSRDVRRAVMFWDVLMVLVMMFLGSTFFWPWLRERPLIFLGYWGICAWLTILATLLAVYDLAKVRLDAKRAHDELKREFLRRADSDSSHDSRSH